MPVWIFCAFGGILAALLVRQAVVIICDGPVPGLGAWFYLMLALSIGIGAYLIYTGGLHP